MTEPVSLDDIKRHLVLDASDTSEDDYLQAMITAARRSVELRTNRSVVSNPQVLVLPCFPIGAIMLGEEPVAAADISYFDRQGTLQLMAAGDVLAYTAVVPAQLLPASGYWPETANRPDAVTVQYQCAALSLEDQDLVAQAIRLIVGHWYANREAVVVDGRGASVELPISSVVAAISTAAMGDVMTPSTNWLRHKSWV